MIISALTLLVIGNKPLLESMDIILNQMTNVIGQFKIKMFYLEIRNESAPMDDRIPKFPNHFLFFQFE
jgi:hypothetical protein